MINKFQRKYNPKTKAITWVSKAHNYNLNLETNKWGKFSFEVRGLEKHLLHYA